MKTHWFGISLFVALSLLLIGCAAQEASQKPEEQPQKVAEEEAKKKEAAEKEAAKRMKGALDTSELPPPRQPVEATPDLNNARLEITARGLELMAEDAVPDEVIQQLRALMGNRYSNARDFLDAVSGAIGADALATHQLSILRNSMSQNLAVEPAFPGTQLRLVARQPVGGSPFGVVYFEFDRSEVKAEFLDTIRRNVNQLQEDPNLQVVIEGHADERGTAEYNIALGQRRANAVRAAMIAHGADAARIVKVVSFGEERPAVAESNEEAWAKNRRGEMAPEQ